MTGRKKRTWEKASDLEKLTARVSFLNRRAEIMDGLWPEEKGVHIWTYRGTTCTIIRND